MWSAFTEKKEETSPTFQDKDTSRGNPIAEIKQFYMPLISVTGFPIGTKILKQETLSQINDSLSGFHGGILSCWLGDE